jgi:4-alpha-glucanotransferase
MHAHARRRGIFLIGDMPIFVNHDSVPVWCQPRLWLLDRRRMPRVVSGTPPDMFAATGQRWGHPIYDWETHAADNFAWWVRRLSGAFRRFDALRIDHFLGFNRMWSIPASAATATKGRWMKSPGHALLTAVRKQLGRLPIIAEDLGLLTPEAAALRDAFELPGMRILQFGFDAPGNAGAYHRPHVYPLQSVAYTGTHDNDTIIGFLKSLTPALRKRLLDYSGAAGRDAHWSLIAAIAGSPANTVIVPMQDLLGLDSRARMNTPGRADGNWTWRLRAGEFSKDHVARLRALTVLYDRAGA